MIDNLRLTNFKSFKSQFVEFSPLTVFAGINCAGKSSILEALKIIYRVYALNDIKSLQEEKDLDSLISMLSIDRFFKIETVWNHDDFVFYFDKDNAPQVSSGIPLDANCLRVVSADRIGPKEFYRVSKVNRGYLWDENGEYIYDFISKADDNKLFVENKLKIAKSSKFLDNVVAWLSIISPNVELDIDYIESGRLALPFYNGVSPVETGFGLSSVLPIIVAILDPTPGTIIIENPEVHLHPKGQTELGKLIAKAVSGKKQIILETHSDHIIDGVRIASACADVAARDVSLLFVSRESYEKESRVKRISVDSAGNLSEWPKDFFDQTIVDAKTLMASKMKNMEKYFND